ncbi:MAG TPA: AI-2E family transporter [Gemmatimonadales bacterium]|nr:AI-2E family transporter [Gemmatimonadales bacterium]
MTSRSEESPAIETDDGSILTPDVDQRALTPEPAPTGEPPNVTKLASLLGENADARHVALVGLFVLALFYTLHLAQAFFLPIVLAILLDFLLSPVVRALRRIGLPEPAGAGIVMLGLIAMLGLGLYYLSGPAARYIALVPQSVEKVRDRIESMRGSMAQVTEAAEQVERVADVGEDDAPQVEIKGPSLTRQLFGGTTALLSAATVVIFLTYFLLAVGDLFLQKIVAVLPQFKDKRVAVTIFRETEAQISLYLFTVTLINIGVGVVTALVVYLLGMPNAVLWGVVAMVLNFVPYVGAVANMVLLALAALMTFEDAGRAMAVPGAFLALNLVESNLVTPMIYGNRMRLNTVALFIGLVFWWYIWGVPGAILAVPMMAAFKIACDHIESLSPIGEFLGK